MKTIFTKHAVERMSERRISRFMVEMAVAMPDAVKPYYDGGKRYIKSLPDGKKLMVGVAREGGSIIVTTVFIRD